MSVLLPNAMLGVRRRADSEERNAHGERVPVGYGPIAGGKMLDGLVKGQADGLWVLGVDPSLWPVRMNDMVVSQGGQAWNVTTADLIEHVVDPTVSWVRLTAQEITQGGTQPGGPWFVARYAESVDPEVPDPGGVPTWQRPGVWTGNGPPPDSIEGAKAGDEYIDLLTGIVYEYR